jgi:hypothetical protein
VDVVEVVGVVVIVEDLVDLAVVIPEVEVQVVTGSC